MSQEKGKGDEPRRAGTAAHPCGPAHPPPRSQIFCDFGPAFIVSDTDGEPPLNVMIASITKDKGEHGARV